MCILDGKVRQDGGSLKILDIIILWPSSSTKTMESRDVDRYFCTHSQEQEVEATQLSIKW